ncbi:MAG: UDP-N-acetylmuramate dehydrogenase [Elusimicrobia bacterium]|nr:UDP-N-acetylmuramate dehydrogenase [Elusimicrobiota bacterium]
MPPTPWAEELRKLFPNARLVEPLAQHTTFHIGGPADVFIAVEDEERLGALLRFAKERALPSFLIGRGSNLLVRDGGIRGVVLRLEGEFERIEFLEGARVRAGAAAPLPRLVMACAERGLAGAEPLAGVPGTVGGGLVMNAGTREGEIGALTRRVRIFDPERLEGRWLEAPELLFSYRRSNLAGSMILVGELVLKAGEKRDILRRVQEQQQRRLRTQPIHTFNVGSVFKNPPGHFAAKLIEEAGLKGLRQGGAKVSELHANFIENDKGASAADVLALIEAVRGKVRERSGVALELEVKVVGEA